MIIIGIQQSAKPACAGESPYVIMRIGAWRTRMLFSARYAACMALALLGLAQNASAWHGLVHYYIGQENTLREGMGPLCNWPDVFGLASEEFCWSHDILPDDTYSSDLLGEYGGYVKCGLPVSHVLYELAAWKVHTWEPSGVGAHSIDDANDSSLGFAFHNLADEVVHYEFFEFPDLVGCLGENHSDPEMSCDIILWYEWMVGWDWENPGGHMKYLKGKYARRLVAPPIEPTDAERESLALISPYYSRGLDTLETAKMWVERNFDPRLIETKNNPENRLVYLSTKIWRQQHPDAAYYHRMEEKETRGDYISAHSWKNAKKCDWTFTEVKASLSATFEEELISLTENLRWRNYYRALTGYPRYRWYRPSPEDAIQSVVVYDVRRMGHFDADQRGAGDKYVDETTFCDKLNLSKQRVEFNAFELTDRTPYPCSRWPEAPPDPPAP